MRAVVYLAKMAAPVLSHLEAPSSVIAQMVGLVLTAEHVRRLLLWFYFKFDLGFISSTSVLVGSIWLHLRFDGLGQVII